MRLEPWHVVVVIVVALLIFGANRLPTLAKSVGQSLKIFKSEMRDLSGTDASSETKQDGKTDDGAGPKA